MVLFCHGGVWASGDRWHYAPLATRLAQAGVVCAVMSYTLYPEAMVRGRLESCCCLALLRRAAAASLAGLCLGSRRQQADTPCVLHSVPCAALLLCR